MSILEPIRRIQLTVSRVEPDSPPGRRRRRRAKPLPAPLPSPQTDSEDSSARLDIRI